jgi:hypothetical protein
MSNLNNTFNSRQLQVKIIYMNKTASVTAMYLHIVWTIKTDL